MSDNFTRRDLLKGTGASLVALAATPALSALQAQPATQAATPSDKPYPKPIATAIPERMRWWNEARFGMFIHWGLYSVLGRHEWAMENEGIPVKDYEQLAHRFNPNPNAARAWAKLAKQAGMKYMVMTTKHHEGYCNFDTKLTNFCSTKQAPGRDLVREYVDAARAEGLRVGFYYSLMDWHHPDGARCKQDESARKRFVEYSHGLIRELMTNYGKVDILWYDVSWPLSADEWESERMNEMVFKLQPGIIVNNRNRLPGDFATPEQKITAETRPWEACMTLNDSWGYQPGDNAWKTPQQVVRNLVSCVRDGGNYLLNIGPKPDGSIPEESVRILTEVGQWVSKNGDAIYGSDPCQVRRSNYASFTRKGNTLYMHVHFWPGDYVAVSGLLTKVTSAKLLSTGKPVSFEQDKFRVRFTGLPKEAPDHPVTTIALECESEPMQDQYFVRNGRPREGVGT
ncbi:MAG TPA: alpha-L-fucosidase [Clostridia bacterium]|nr:alpha-L-fucosidase [Clostridia bacterium]